MINGPIYKRGESLANEGCFQSPLDLGPYRTLDMKLVDSQKPCSPRSREFPSHPMTDVPYMLLLVPDELPSFYRLLVDFLIRGARACNRLYKVYRSPLNNQAIESDINTYLECFRLNRELQPLRIIVIENNIINETSSQKPMQFCDLSKRLKSKLKQMQVYTSQIQVHQISMNIIQPVEPIASPLKAIFTNF